MLEPADRLIIALDVPSTEEARAIVEDIGDAGQFYKIGLQLIPIGGLDLARELKAAGKRVFLDFKLYDISNTVEKAVASIAVLGADFLTIHGDPEILAAAMRGRGGAPLKLFAVTVLTSLDDEALQNMGYQESAADLVMRRAAHAAEAGCDGVIASPQEASALKTRFGDKLLLTTPGVRPAGAALGDQKRVMTPAQAIKAGADYLVVGRPITGAEDKHGAAQAIAADMEDLERL